MNNLSIDLNFEIENYWTCEKDTSNFEFFDSTFTRFSKLNSSLKMKI